MESGGFGNGRAGKQAAGTGTVRLAPGTCCRKTGKRKTSKNDCLATHHKKLPSSAEAPTWLGAHNCARRPRRLKEKTRSAGCLELPPALQIPENTLAFVVAEHRMRDEAAVVLLRCAVEAGLDDAMAESIEIGNLEGLELARKEFLPLARAYFGNIGSALDLFYNAEGDAGNRGALAFERTGNVAEQREGCFVDLFAAKARAAAPARYSWAIHSAMKPTLYAPKYWFGSRESAVAGRRRALRSALRGRACRFGRKSPMSMA